MLHTRADQQFIEACEAVGIPCAAIDSMPYSMKNPFDMRVTVFLMLSDQVETAIAIAMLVPDVVLAHHSDIDPMQFVVISRYRP